MTTAELARPATPQESAARDPWRDSPRIQAALERVGQSFTMLEQAVENILLNEGDAGGESLHGQIAALKAENARLMQLLDMREADVAELSQLNAQVSDRLETSIQTLRTIIEK